MAIVPLLVNLARELDTEYSPLAGDLDHLLDDDFGFGIHPMEIFRSSRPSLLLHPRRRHLPYDRHHHALARRGAALRHVGGGGGRDEGSSSQLLPTIGNEGFQVCMDVSKFKPNELSVKTVDKTIVVEGKHEEREDDHGLIQRHFVRKYTLPKDYDPQDVISTISSDGILTVKAPPPPGKAIKQNERIVQIQQTGPAHLSVKAPEQPQLQDGNVKSVDQAQNGGKQQNKMETGK